MRVLTVTKIRNLFEIHEDVWREITVAADSGKMLANLAVVPCGAQKCFLSETEQKFALKNAATALQGIEDRHIIFRRGDDGDILKVLRRGPNHRRPTDVDVLDDLFELHSGFSDGLHKRI